MDLGFSRFSSRKSQKSAGAHKIGAAISGSSIIGKIERGVPQAAVRARVSSATLCSVRVLRVGLDTYPIRIQTRTPCHGTHPYDYSKIVLLDYRYRLPVSGNYLRITVNL